MDNKYINWKIIPKDTPKIIKRCPRCEKKLFVCSELFRMNSNKKSTDVWLIYDCEHCKYTWNMDIIVRKNTKDINEERFEKFIQNDSQLAWEFAFNKEILAKNKARIENNYDILIEGDLTDLKKINNGKYIIRFFSDYHLAIPIKKIVRMKFKLSNSNMNRLFEENTFKLVGNSKRLKNNVSKEFYLEINLDNYKHFLAKSNKKI